MALDALEHLVVKANSEKVRLEAAKTLLDRIGVIAPSPEKERSRVDVPLHEQTAEELRALADKIERELFGRAKPVNATTSDPNLTDEIEDKHL